MKLSRRWLLVLLVEFAGFPCPRDAPFGFDSVRHAAQQLAQQPYRDTTAPLPREIDGLNYDAMRLIYWNESSTLWKNLHLPFQVKFSQRGGNLRNNIHFCTVDPSGAVQPFLFSPDLFDYSQAKLSAPPPADAGFGGFRVHYALNNPNYLDEAIVFAGASYFRSLAQNQVYGLSCRGLAINSGIQGITEEFPVFTTFWLVQPEAHANELTFYALLDGPSVAGAYQFKLRPGAETSAEVTAALYFRSAVAHLGVAPLTSMFWYGKDTDNHFGDYRPEVHDSDGALIANGRGEWLWRPLQHYLDVRLNSFEDDNPRGFGLLQRDRNFDHYQDLIVNYQSRPSCWVEPLGNWGKGRVELVQLPSPVETIDNVVLYWDPATPPRAGESMDVKYRLHWFMDDPRLPPLANVTATRISHATELFPLTRIIVDFSGPGMETFSETNLPQAAVSSTEGVPIKNVHVFYNRYAHAIRVSFGLPIENKTCELRCRLQRPDGAPLSETWTYTWTP